MSDSQNNPIGNLTGQGTMTIEQGRDPLGADGAPDTDNAADQSYLLNYVSKEDAEKGYKELQALSTKKAQEAAEYKRELEALRMQADMSELKKSVGSVTSMREAEAQRAHEEAFARHIESLKERVGDEGPEVLVDEFNTALFNQKQEFQKELKKYEDVINSLKGEFSGQLGQTRLELSPEYQRLKPTMDELKQQPEFKDSSVEQLMAIAKVVKGKEPDNDPASIPPGMGGSRLGVRATEEPKGLDDARKQFLMDHYNYSKAEVEKMDLRLRGKLKE